MSLELLKPKIKKKSKKRVGRGNASGFGGECGRGHKGQKSRSGFSKKLGFEGGQMPLYKRIPKLKGFKTLNKKEVKIIDLNMISSFFKDEEVVSYESLVEKKLIAKNQKYKILNNGKLTAKIILKTDCVSGSVLKKIDK